MIFKRSLSQELLQTAIGAFTVLFGIVIAQRITYYIGIAYKWKYRQQCNQYITWV
jgi:lipopolysaccharide export system permease protein